MNLQSADRKLTPIAEALPELLSSLPRMVETEEVPLRVAVGRILGTEVLAGIDVPPYSNSAMDGYAVRAAEFSNERVFPVSQRIAAGEVGGALNTGSVARIFTGAPLPPGADAVVMQENVESSSEGVRILQSVQPSENVRAVGEDIKTGQLLFKQGQRLYPQDIGVLASVGLSQIAVRRRLRVALLVTGDELALPGTPLRPGQIYNSNYFTLHALLSNLCAEVIETGVVEDDYESTRSELMRAAEEADAIVSTGGVSVGEEDHVKAAVESLGGLDLWKLAIKPGKPFASGKVCGKQFFGLPGNPVSAFVTFVLLVRPALLAMQGTSHVFPGWLDVPVGFAVDRSGERQEYLRVCLQEDGDGNTLLERFDNQSSGVGVSLSLADGLAVVPPQTAVSVGDKLKFLPFSELV